MLVLQTDTERITRIVIEGEPGSGKTTFMKAVCRAWMATTQGNLEENADIEQKLISRYKILLAIILRQMTTGIKTFIEMIGNQFNFLTLTEVYSLVKLVQDKPNELCLFFDGFDEWAYSSAETKDASQNKLVNILAGKDKQNVVCITTTRSQGVSQLQRFNIKAVQARVKLCGFNKEQIKKYISAYFRMKTEDASAMFEYINENNLLALASIPIRLQMMCFVWNSYQKLGNTCAELYSLLLKGLLDHMEKRDGIKREGEEDLIKAYHESVLFPTSTLANTWDSNGNLKILFSTDDIMQVTKEHKKVKNFGCVTQYFASSKMPRLLWNFSHLSLQEYFVAYNITHSKASLQEFLNRCLDKRALENYRLIIEFLCYLAPERSNQIITSVVSHDYEEHECIQIMNYILTFIGAYSSQLSVDIPLPRIVNIGNDQNSERMDYLSHLFYRDFIKHKNMAELKIHQLEALPEGVQIGYIKGLYMVIHEQEQVPKAQELLTQLTEDMTRIDIVFNNSKLKQTDMKLLLSVIETKSIRIFSVKGCGVAGLACDIIAQQPKLEVLTVNDTKKKTESDVENMKDLSDNANKSKNFKELKIVGFLPDMISMPLKSDIKLTFCNKYDEKNQFDTFCTDIIQQKPNITMMDLSFSSFSSFKPSDVGTKLGQLLVYLQTLVILRLRKCGITKQNIVFIEKEIIASKTQIPLQECDLLGNKLVTMFDLQGLLDCCPKLKVLLLSYREKSKPPKLSEETNVVLATGTKSKPTVLSFTESMKHLHKLYMIYIDPEFLAVKRYIQYKVRVIYMQDMTNAETTLVNLSVNLKYMKQLEELHITSTKTKIIKRIDCILSLLKNLPPSLRTLSLYGYESTDIILVLEVKHELKKLLRLNIGSPETVTDTIQIIRQELQQLNGEIEVYSDQNEVLSALLAYSTVNPSSLFNKRPLKEANDILDVLR